MNGLIVVRREAWHSLQDLAKIDSSAAWWGLLLNMTEPLQAGEVLHVPHVFGHRLTDTRIGHEPPLPSATEVGLVQAHLDRCAPGAVAHAAAEGGVHVHYPVPDSAPLVSLIIPTRNGLRLLRQCAEHCREDRLRELRNRHRRQRVGRTGNPRVSAKGFAWMRGYASFATIDRLISALNNAAARICRGELLGLINNDIEVIGSDWLRAMVSLALRRDVGAVGARLWFADRTLQHAGVVLGIGGVAGHIHRQLPSTQPGYQGRARLTQEFSAVTAACMVLRKEVFDALGGLDETNLAVDYNDIDFCLRIRRAAIA